jgi:hypothetical protein
MTISEKEWRWVKRMQKAGLFPTTPEPAPPAPMPPDGAWRVTHYPDGNALVEINNVPLPLETALQILRLMNPERVVTDVGTIEALAERPPS